MTRHDSIVVGTLVVLLALVAGLVGLPALTATASASATATPPDLGEAQPYREGLIGHQGGSPHERAVEQLAARGVEPRDIVNYVADNPSGHRAFIRHLFNHMVKQQIPAYGMLTLDELQRQFSATGCNIQKLLMEIALVASLDGRAAPAAVSQSAGNF